MTSLTCHEVMGNSLDIHLYIYGLLHIWNDRGEKAGLSVNPYSVSTERRGGISFPEHFKAVEVSAILSNIYVLARVQIAL